MKHLVLLLSAFVFLSSCEGDDEEQKLETLDNKSAREVTLLTVTNGDSVYHITRQNIWFAGNKIAEKVDTIVTPSKVAAWGAVDTNLSISRIPIYVTVQ